jgi:ABC-type phosphate transport system substrate-binding protein
VGLGVPSAAGKYAWADILNGCGAGVPATGANAITVYQRFDAGGTEDAFCTLIADLSKTGGSTSGLCSSGELVLLGTQNSATNPTGTACDGNLALEACVLGNADGLAFMSYGNAKGTTAKVAKYGTTTNVIAPTDAKVKDGARGVSGGYDASRKLWLITAGAPSSQEQQYLDFFVNNAANNKAFASAAGFIGINE